MLRNSLAVGAAIAMIATIVCIVVGSYYLIQASFNRAPSAPYRRRVKYFWLNAALFPDQLSNVGLRHRSRYLVFRTAALVSGATMIAFVLALALSKP